MEIDADLPLIAQTIAANDIVAINAPTGYGKSLRVPQILAAAGYQVMIAVPTITAARQLTIRQRTLSTDKRVEFAAEGYRHYNEQTNIAYVTAGHMRRKLLRYIRNGACRQSGMDLFTRNEASESSTPYNEKQILIVDEVHAGTVDNHIILAIWRHCLALGAWVPKLVLSSATLSSNDIPVLNGMNISLIEIGSKSANIEIRYQERNYNIGDDTLYSDMARRLLEYHTTLSIDNVFLVFAPGTAEVRRIIEILETAKNMLVLPAYAALSDEDLGKIYQPAAAGLRKVIVATNVAETAITIPDVGLVIDSMLEKVSETSPTDGPRLVLKHTSRSSAVQRCGRTGRTRPGICHRMCKPDFFLTLEINRQPEILRVPLSNYIIEILDAGLDPRSIFATVPRQKVDNSLRILSQLKMIDADRKVTALGHFVTRLPLSVRNAAVIWHCLQTQTDIFPCVLVACLIDVYDPSYFYYPMKEVNESGPDYNQRIHTIQQSFAKYMGRSDLHTFLNMWNDLIVKTDGLNGGKRAISKWSQENSINNRKINELIRLLRRIMKSFRQEQSKETAAAQKSKTVEQIGEQQNLFSGKNLAALPIETNVLIDNLRPILAQVYSDLIMTVNQGPRRAMIRPGTKPESNRRTSYSLNGVPYFLDNRAVNQLLIDPSPRVIALLTRDIQSRGTTRVINVALDLPADPNQAKRPGAAGKCPRPVKTPGPLASSLSVDVSSAIAALQGMGLNVPSTTTSTTTTTSSTCASGNLVQMNLTVQEEKDLANEPSVTTCTTGQEDKKDDEDYSSVRQLKQMTKFLKTVTAAQYNLNVDQTVIWDQNPHLRQVFANSRTLVRPRRELTVQDRMLQPDWTAQPSPTSAYQERKCEVKTMDHWGQRKLLLSEIEFFNYYLGEGQTIVVYIGAAPGLHIQYLSLLYPQVVFLLFDPRAFEVVANDKIHLYQKFFTDEDAALIAKSYNPQNLLLISDMRTDPGQELSGKGFSAKVEADVFDDMTAQKGWVQTIRPKAAMLKFRLPYTAGKTEYFPGIIFFQVWAGPTSSETRLIVDHQGLDRQVTYDNLWYSDALHYFNTRTRETYYEHDIHYTESGLDHCFDCASEILILKTYLTKTYPQLASDQKLLDQQVVSLSKLISDNISHSGRNLFIV